MSQSIRRLAELLDWTCSTPAHVCEAAADKIVELRGFLATAASERDDARKALRVLYHAAQAFALKAGWASGHSSEFCALNGALVGAERELSGAGEPEQPAQVERREAVDAVGNAVDSIWADLMDRSGITPELGACDPDVQDEIKQMMRRKIADAAGWTLDGKGTEK